jgi:hypothetical protein
MLELLQDALPWLGALYVAGCLTQLRRGELTLAAPWPGRFRPLGPGLHLLPLLPTAEVIRALDAPVVPGQAHLHLRAGHSRRDPPVLEPGDLEPLPSPPEGGVTVEGAKLRLGPAARLATPSPGHARALAEALAGGGSVTEDPAAIAPRFARLAVARWALALSSALAFAAWFVLLPVAAYGGATGAPALVPGLVLAAVAHLAVVASAAVLLARARVGLGAGLQHLAPVLLFPPGGARALAHVGRDLHPRDDGVLLAASLLRDDALRSFARVRLARLERTRAALGATDAAGWATARAAALGRVLLARGLDERELSAAPAPASADAAAFCPTCEGQFRQGVATCPDCRMDLVGLRAG